MIASGKDPQALAQAAACIQAGGLVGFPTETVYGLGADALNDAAVAGIFSAKGRPTSHPLIVHIAGAHQVEHYASNVPPFAQLLMQAFWPGPLTLILPRRAHVATAAAAGQESIGLRCPEHPVALALLQACATGLAAPSANRFGRISPTTAAHVAEELGSSLLVLDGGPCQIGIESSIVDCTRGQPVLLRPGVLTQAQLQSACGQTVWRPHELPAATAATAPRASGTLQAHYAPQAKVRLMPTQALQDALMILGKDSVGLAVYAKSPMKPASAEVLLRKMPDNAAAAAQQLFATLRELDAHKVQRIWIELPPPTPEWEGVHDRLARAAAASN